MYLKKLYFLLILSLLTVWAYCGNMTFCVLDVGQGLCCAVISPDRHCMVFDCGSVGSKKNPNNSAPYKYALAPYLKENGIKKVDYLVLSHPNTDHYSGFPDLVSNYPIGTYIKNGFSSSSVTYNELQKSLAKKKLKAQVAKSGQAFSLGTSVKCTVLAPFGGKATGSDNDQSVMIRLVYGNTSFLLSGDATAYEERQLVRIYGKSLGSSVLLCGHHGSKYSTCLDFLAKVKPKAAVISCGQNNSYGHPAKDTLDRLNRIKCKVYRTDKDGSVTIISDGKKLTVKKGKKADKNKFNF